MATTTEATTAPARRVVSTPQLTDLSGVIERRRNETKTGSTINSARTPSAVEPRRSRVSSVTSLLRRLSMSGRPSTASQASFTTADETGYSNLGTMHSTGSFIMSGDKFGTMRSTTSLVFAEQPELERQQLSGKKTLRTADQVVMLQTQISELKASLEAKNRHRMELAHELERTVASLAQLENELQTRTQIETSIQTYNENMRQQIISLKEKVQKLSKASKEAEAAYNSEKRNSQSMYLNYMRMLDENEKLKLELAMLYERDESTVESN